MRLLYHFSVSPYSRRTRLALLHKGIHVELRDSLGDPALLDEAQRIGSLKTIPVFVEEDGRILSDSTSITHYLDRAYPSAPPIWPTAPGDAHAVFETVSLTEAALTNLIDLGVRYYSLSCASTWDDVRKEFTGRAQRALDALSDRVSSMTRPTVAASGWSGADMWLITAVTWLELVPVIAPDAAFAAQVVSLGWKLPPALQRWADQHRDRDDVRAVLA